jgi:hypothetical protein
MESLENQPLTEILSGFFISGADIVLSFLLKINKNNFVLP